VFNARGKGEMSAGHGGESDRWRARVKPNLCDEATACGAAVL
jgi:hypothetical protein